MNLVKATEISPLNYWCRLRGLLIGLVLIWSVGSDAQEPAMRQYTVDDGLPSSLVYHVLEDQQGFIWIGTDMGVCRFDGYEFKTFTTKDGLPSNDVWRIQEDQAGRMWLSTFNEVVYIEKDQVFRLPLSTIEIQGQMPVNHYIDDQFNHLIYIYPDFYVLSPNQQLQRIPRESLIYFNGTKVLVFSIDNLGLIKFDQKFAATSARGEQQHLYFDRMVYPDYDDWLKTRVNRYKDMATAIRLGSSKILFSLPNQLVGFDPVRQIETDLSLLTSGPVLSGDYVHDNLSWIYDGQEVICIDSNFQRIQQLDFLRDKTLNTLVRDRKHNLWLNTNNGIYFLSEQARYSQSYRLPITGDNHEIIKLAVDATHRLWLGAANGDLYWYDPKFGDIQLAFRGLLPKGISVLAISPDQQLYAGGKLLYQFPIVDLIQGKAVLRGKESYQVSTKSDEKDSERLLNLKEILLTNNEEVLATASLCHVTIQKDHSIKLHVGKKTTYIYAMAQGPDHRIWTGRKTGIGQFINGKNESLQHLNPLFRRPINDLVFRGNALWVATDGYGLFRYQEGVIDTITELEGEIIKSVHLDQQQRVWVATNKGVGQVNVQSQDPLQYDFRQLTIDHGLQSNEVNQVLVDSHFIYVATKKGLTILDATRMDTIADTGPIVFTRFTVNNRDTVLLEHYELQHYEQDIEIEFVCLSYESQGHITYEYKMEGIDTTWQTTTARRKEYPLLPPGDYRFYLKATDVNGHQSAEAIQLGFTIAPPWWATWEFQLSAVLIGLLGLIGGTRVWIRQERKKIVERTTIEKKFAELELRALQAQMNPHFVFNALHSIQEFIFDKDERTANAYLVKFSRLMRLFLESSKEKYILLKDEIQLLKLYIELEKLRFEDKFDFVVEVDPLLEPDLVELPSMLLQPFVENAINHGILHKTGKGQLWIKMEKAQNQLRCTVEDDGVGRAKAMEIKQKTYKAYKSRGMEIVRERQRVMNLISEARIDIKIIDLLDSSQQPCGTKVIISTPLLI